MSYAIAADFRERTLKSWTANLLLTEADGTDDLINLFIAQVAGQLELELDDDFDPPTPDNDETIFISGTIGSRLYVHRRVRSLTTVSTRSLSGTITALTATSYRLQSSLNAAGMAMIDGRKRDWIDSLSVNTWLSDGGIQLVGKFGWAQVPNDIKRLVALRVYEMIKVTGDPLSTITQQTTVDASRVFGESREMSRLISIYGRRMPMTA
ncbi:MAG: hypothetical protein ACRDIC_06155 [bacterium]